MKVYTEDGYGSYSLSFASALRYAQMDAEGKMVFLARTLDAGDCALYLGHKEEEMLVGRGCEYTVEAVAPVEKGVLSSVCGAIMGQGRKMPKAFSDRCPQTADAGERWRHGRLGMSVFAGGKKTERGGRSFRLSL